MGQVREAIKARNTTTDWYIRVAVIRLVPVRATIAIMLDRTRAETWTLSVTKESGWQSTFIRLFVCVEFKKQPRQNNQIFCIQTSAKQQETPGLDLNDFRPTTQQRATNQ
jgi:hypothetical protein